MVFPVNEVADGAPEAMLDMRRFFSDGIAGFLIELRKTVEALAPGVPHSSNHYSGKEDLGFDLLRYSDRFVDYPGIGHYPGFAMNDKAHYALMIAQERLCEQDRPLWCLEYQSRGGGVFAGPKGWLYAQAMLSLLCRTQMILDWTWRTMLNGEEAFWGGLLGHDGMPTPNFEEYRRIAADFRKLEATGLFPRRAEPGIAVAFSQESLWATQAHAIQFRQRYTDAVLQAHKALYALNLDYNMVNLRDLKRDYALLIVPGHVMMDERSAEALRSYVHAFGRGTACYLAAEANEALLARLIRDRFAAPDIPEGVQMRELAPGRRFYVNLTNRPATLALSQPARGLLSDTQPQDTLVLPPYGAELLTEVGEADGTSHFGE